MKKIRKNTQVSLINPKGAGRPAKVDRGIRHISREKINRPSALHLTIKVRENKADIKNKRILKALHYAIRRARLQGLRVVHYTLEYNHVHLLVEANDNKSVQKGMQALGISFSKAINKIKQVKGSVYKHRHHFRKLNSRREYKNVIQYIFRNGIKHKRSLCLIDPFNSLVAEKRIPADIKNIIENSRHFSHLRRELEEFLDPGKLFYLNQSYLWD